MVEKKPGHIHGAKTVATGGRYDRVISFLRSHPGATTREIMLGTNVCAVSAIVSELRVTTPPHRIECEYKRTTEQGARIHRYYLIETAAQVLQGELF